MTLLEKIKTVIKLAANILHKSNDFYEQSSDYLSYPSIKLQFNIDSKRNWVFGSCFPVPGKTSNFTTICHSTRRISKPLISSCKLRPLL